MRGGDWLDELGASRGVTFIAEAGVNHNGDLATALLLVDKAAEAGADFVKFQTFNTKQLVRSTAPMAAYQRRNVEELNTQYELLRELELAPKALGEIQERCREKGVGFLSTPFDFESADLLNEMGVPAFKISSTDVTNLPFLHYVAGLGRPLILSTGMSYLGEVEDAVKAIEEGGCSQLAILHCTTNYPTEPGQVNLRAMETLRSFGYPVGYSDHTLGGHVPVAAAALGARVIEKHFTIDRELPGPDHRASATPEELTALVREIREVVLALGSARKAPDPAEEDARAVVRRSLVASRNLDKGTVIRSEDLTSKRPAEGISPRWINLVVGQRLRRPLAESEALGWGDIE